MIKKIVIFGGSSGLGLEIAKTFGNEKKLITIISSNEDKLKKACEIIKDLNINCDYFKCDLSDSTQVDNVCNYIKTESQTIEAIIFCSAKGYFGKFKDLKISKIEDNLKVNALSYIKILNRSIHFNESFRYIYVSSYASKIPLSNMSIYSSSKILVDKIFEVLKLEYEKGKFLTVYPGPMNTDFDDNAYIENNVKIRKARKKKNSNLISKKIYNSYVKQSDILEINSLIIKIILILRSISSSLFYSFLRFFK